MESPIGGQAFQRRLRPARWFEHFAGERHAEFAFDFSRRVVSGRMIHSISLRRDTTKQDPLAHRRPEIGLVVGLGDKRVSLPCPQPPDWSIDWQSLDLLPWLQDMRGCPQNPERHAEGDVWTHVHLVVEAMVAQPEWRELPECERRILFAAALLHDVAKPACTRIEPDGRISARGHSWRGAVRARNILWRLGVPFAEREAVCAIVRHHLVPFFLADSQNPQRMAIEVSQTARCNHLAIMAEADVRGRICPDPQKLLNQIARFRETVQRYGCQSRPFEFPSSHARFLYFRDPTRRPESPAPEDFRCDVVLLSGLPSAGKDYWLEQNLPDWPVVSLDCDSSSARHSAAGPAGDRAGPCQGTGPRTPSQSNQLCLECAELEPQHTRRLPAAVS